MVQHSIIIPSSGREKNLSVCLKSIEWSAEVCGTPQDYEVLVVGRDIHCGINDHSTSVLCDDTPPVALRQNENPPYWKGHMQNIGIRHAKGDVLTFLDADAVVGKFFMRNPSLFILDSSLTKIAYRVRNKAYCDWPGVWKHFFESYDDYPLAYEDFDGNSQFSITREKLGDMRFDENYYGRGFEDLSFIRTIREHYGKDYKCRLVTEGDFAMFHIKHEPTPGFASDRWSRRNQRLYDGDTCVWAFCNTKRAASSLAENHFSGRICSDKDFASTLSETIPGDTILEIKEVQR